VFHHDNPEYLAAMPKVTFIKPDGSESIIDAKLGLTLMQVGIDNGIAGIVAECGGCCQCATCHVYVAPEWCARLKPVGEGENAMLDNTVTERLPESRLSCEITVTPELDGLVVHLPVRQV
jgi:ferredoxin, 2Fe-2S